MWLGIIALGGLVVSLFSWFVFNKKQNFDAPLLGLLVLGMALISIGIIQPDSIKYGDLELKKAKQEAEDATKLAYEATALLIWNEGRFGGGLKDQEKVATRLLEHVYGKDALPYRYFLQHQGLFLTPQEELQKVPKGSLPSNVTSPFYEKYLKGIAKDKNSEE